MCEPTKLKFDLPVGTWGTTEVEVEYPWHRDLDSIILPLLETAHEAQAERQKETRELRASEAYRVTHPGEHRSSELRAGDLKQSLHSSDHHRAIPSANAAKVIMSAGAKRKKWKDKTMPSRPNEEVRVCLKGVDSTKWMTMMRGDYFQNLLDAYARECEPHKDTTRLKVFWNGRWVNNLETPDDLGLEADAKFEVYELVQTRPRILVPCTPKGHQRDPCKASIKTMGTTLSNDERPVTAPNEPSSVAAAISGEHRPSTAHSALSTSFPEAGSMKATTDPTDFQMPADVPSRGSSKRTSRTGLSSKGSGSLAAEYEARCVAIHGLRYASSNKAIKKVSVPSPVAATPQQPGKFEVPSAPTPAQRSRSPSPTPTPIQASPSTEPDPPSVMIEPLLGSQRERRRSLHLAIPGVSVSTDAPFIPPQRTATIKECGTRASVAGYRYQKAVLREQVRESLGLTPVVLNTTIESGGRRIGSNYRTSLP